MIGVRKSFSEQLKKDNEVAGRDAVAKYCMLVGWEVVGDPDDIFGIDLLIKGKPIRVEVERRGSKAWHGVTEGNPTGRFYRDTVHILCRKERLLDEGKVFWYATVSFDCKRIGFLSYKKLKKYMNANYAKSNPNMFFPDGDEYVFDIPKHEFKWVAVPE